MVFIFFIMLVACVVMIVVNSTSKERDGDRIAEYIKSRGGEMLLLKASRRTFARSAQQRGDRLYDLTYRDRHGNVHETLCITGFHKKVYFTEDDIVEQALTDNASAMGFKMTHDTELPAAATGPDIRQEEIDRLRAENDSLRAELQKYTGPLMR